VIELCNIMIYQRNIKKKISEIQKTNNSERRTNEESAFMQY
jgi:hypothetical protein